MGGGDWWGEGNMSSTEDTNMNPISVRILLPTFQGEFPRTGAMCTSEQEKRVRKGGIVIQKLRQCCKKSFLLITFDSLYCNCKLQL